MLGDQFGGLSVEADILGRKTLFLDESSFTNLAPDFHEAGIGKAEAIPMTAQRRAGRLTSWLRPRSGNSV